MAGLAAAKEQLTKMKIELPGATDTNDAALGGCRTIESAYEFNAQMDQIGEGTYGQVYLAKSKEKDPKTNLPRRVALKKIRMDTEKEGFPITAIREIRILSTLDHPNVIKLREIVRSQVHKCNNYKGSIYMVFDFMEHDLTGLQDRHGGKFSLSDVKCYMQQLLGGLHYCHEHGILHRDLKASNLLIGNDGTLKLADFGLARVYQDDQHARLTNRVITLWYRPPELLLGADTYGPEVDVWSVGCIFAELLTGKPLFPGKDEADQLDKIFQVLGTPTEATWPGVNRLEHFKMVPPNKHKNKNFRDYCKQRGIVDSAVPLLEAMLTLDPKKRIDSKTAYMHNFFTSDPQPTPREKLQKFEPSHEWTMKKLKRERQQHAGGAHYDPNDPNKRQRYQQGGHQQQQGQHMAGGYRQQGGQPRHYGRGGAGDSSTSYPPHDARGQRTYPPGRSGQAHTGYPQGPPGPSAPYGAPPQGGHWQGAPTQGYANPYGAGAVPPPAGYGHPPHGGYPQHQGYQQHAGGGKPLPGGYQQRDGKGHHAGGQWQGGGSSRR